jgi:uncharacterized protein
MLFLLSPAKTLDYDTPAPGVPHTLARFPEQSARLVEVLRRKSPAQLGRLMDISEALATLNAGRYQAWSPDADAPQAKQAVLAFAGDVYEGLQASTLTADDLAWAQEHLRILSGLYGVLRPLDRIQAHRLEMGTALKVGTRRNLYDFWGPAIAEALNRDLAADPSPVVVNLASQEYFRSVDLSALRARVVECVFEEGKAGGWKVVSFFAKKARGLMARFAIRERLVLPQQLRAFDLDGYRFDEGASTAGRLVFRRTMQG